jgi:FkbM family methyltransferase
VREFFGHGACGFFVEVGANEPELESQTWHLEQAGWTGVLVEPQPALAEKLRHSRRAQVVEAACTSPAHAGESMALHIAGPYSSFSAALMVTGVEAETVIKVETHTLDDILVGAGAPVPLDFLSIDVEGHELEVLRGFDFARWRPRLILIEDHVADLSKHRFLRRAGYRLVRRSSYNGWYVPQDAAFDLSWLGHWQLLRKYYLGLPVRKLRDAKRRLRDRIKTRLGIRLLSWREAHERNRANPR